MVDKKGTIRKLKIAKGQIDGLIRMIEEDRDICDIGTQILATVTLLKNSSKKIILDDIEESADKDTFTKVEDAIKLIEKF